MHFFGSFLLLTAYYYYHWYANKLKEAEPLKHTVFILQLPSYHKQCIYSPLSTNASILSLNGCKCSSGDSQQTPCTFFSHPATTTERRCSRKGKGHLPFTFHAHKTSSLFCVPPLFYLFSKHVLREKNNPVFSLPPPPLPPKKKKSSYIFNLSNQLHLCPSGRLSALPL